MSFKDRIAKAVGNYGEDRLMDEAQKNFKLIDGRYATLEEWHQLFTGKCAEYEEKYGREYDRVLEDDIYKRNTDKYSETFSNYNSVLRLGNRQKAQKALAWNITYDTSDYFGGRKARDHVMEMMGTKTKIDGEYYSLLVPVEGCELLEIWDEKTRDGKQISLRRVIPNREGVEQFLPIFQEITANDDDYQTIRAGVVWTELFIQELVSDIDTLQKRVALVAKYIEEGIQEEDADKEIEDYTQLKSEIPYELLN